MPARLADRERTVILLTFYAENPEAGSARLQLTEGNVGRSDTARLSVPDV
jgi:hypothetical protein